MKLLLFVLAIAIVTYVVIRLLQDRGISVGHQVQRRRAPRPQRPSRPLAPDDDEDFLRDLDRKRLDPPDD